MMMSSLEWGMVYFVGVGGFSALLLLAAKMLGKKSRANMYAASAFECGFQAMSNARMPFSLKFYIVALVFLVFDVELILILPYFCGVMATPWSMLCVFWFMMVLFLGLIHECNEGAMEWQ
uniref:NADH-ubiquinone oxidoreductase chain 3 n=1 Tax=Tridacna gigas TaxID=80829 RepID=A0A7G8QB98_TRIGG|nr:NADH dehydrogenase subunit 3 [Tridacna gigas]QNK04056.1 NADH dehydrogenase subunit 3 [Tridacna gigas]